MAGSFTFGIIGYVNPLEALIAMIVTILFLRSFESLTEKVEHYLELSPVYSQILQNAYKELMTMGLLGFIITIYDASYTNQSEMATHWLSVFNFAEYVLFFNAVFSLLHATVIVIFSIVASNNYGNCFNESLTHTLLEINETEENKWTNLIYRMR